MKSKNKELMDKLENDGLNSNLVRHHRDPRKTMKYQPKDYVSIDKITLATETELKEKMNQTLNDDLRYAISEVLRMWD